MVEEASDDGSVLLVETALKAVRGGNVVLPGILHDVYSVSPEQLPLEAAARALGGIESLQKFAMQSACIRVTKEGGHFDALTITVAEANPSTVGFDAPPGDRYQELARGSLSNSWYVALANSIENAIGERISVRDYVMQRPSTRRPAALVVPAVGTRRLVAVVPVNDRAQVGRHDAALVLIDFADNDCLKAFTDLVTTHGTNAFNALFAVLLSEDVIPSIQPIINNDKIPARDIIFAAIPTSDVRVIPGRIGHD